MDIACVSEICALPVFPNPRNSLACTVVALGQKHSTSCPALIANGRKVPNAWEFTTAVPETGAKVESQHSFIIPYKLSPEGLSGTLRMGVKTECVDLFSVGKSVCIINVLIK